MGTLDTWRSRARAVKTEVRALYLAYRDPRVPWYARAFAALVVGYALSPIDLIPDPIPVLGYLDDLVLLPLGVVLARRLIPAAVLQECREKVQAMGSGPRPRNWIAGTVILALWVCLFIAVAVLSMHLLAHP
ncbi:MAG: YkvA family protein [Chloroflexota bacterium]|nr:YkvA family protein [Chloroflexota bacterium]